MSILCQHRYITISYLKKKHQLIHNARAEIQLEDCINRNTLIEKYLNRAIETISYVQSSLPQKMWNHAEI